MAQVSQQFRVNEQNGRRQYMFFSRGSIEGVYTLKAEGRHQVIHQPSGFMRLHLLAGVVNLPQLFPLYALSDLGTACKADVFYTWMAGGRL